MIAEWQLRWRRKLRSKLYRSLGRRRVLIVRLSSERTQDSVSQRWRWIFRLDDEVEVREMAVVPESGRVQFEEDMEVVGRWCGVPVLLFLDDSVILRSPWKSKMSWVILSSSDPSQRQSTHRQTDTEG
ncbi:hypothetical protein DPMN_012194 [Dreissena polymorpha]|uniref:Uncharacterized protein n=1 Tax=Dreissena polymorpha TaxID=45954 RepID=A0A9D4S134_DREPO|nr:hypothetical protein DPMN_012194 [Dreissena polymorpha]